MNKVANEKKKGNCACKWVFKYLHFKFICCQLLLARRKVIWEITTLPISHIFYDNKCISEFSMPWSLAGPSRRQKESPGWVRVLLGRRTAGFGGFGGEDVFPLGWKSWIACGSFSPSCETRRWPCSFLMLWPQAAKPQDTIGLLILALVHHVCRRAPGLSHVFPKPSGRAA